MSDSFLACPLLHDVAGLAYRLLCCVTQVSLYASVLWRGRLQFDHCSALLCCVARVALCASVLWRRRLQFDRCSAFVMSCTFGRLRLVCPEVLDCVFRHVVLESEVRDGVPRLSYCIIAE